MPEGPEVKIVVDYLNKSLKNKKRSLLFHIAQNLIKLNMVK